MTQFFHQNLPDFGFIKSRLLTMYADWKVSASPEEKRSFNRTNRILLTFDDFADTKTVKAILAILKKEKVKAAFFVVGEWARKNPDLIKTIKLAGHWLGNHTRTHQNLVKISEKEARVEITGGPASTLLRPPYGAYNNQIRKIARDLGYRICYWDIDTEDWKGISAEEIKSRIFRSIHKGACILMHLNGANTVKALPDIIKGLRDRGYVLCFDGKEIAR